MSRIVRVVCIIAILLIAAPFPASAAAPATPQLPPNCQEIPITDPQTQKTTETYLICMPPDAQWNGSLVVFAHGYVFDYPATESPTLPVEQIITSNTSLPALVNALGYGFAMTSYSKNGLAVKQGVQDTIKLVSYVRALKAPRDIRKVFVVGASEGGLITTQLIESHSDIFDGGIAVCGPIGDFQKQINYWGDFRAVFDYYFPSVLPDDAVTIPEDPLMIDWVKGFGVSTYQTAIVTAMSAQANQLSVYNLFQVTGAPIVPTNINTVGETTLGILSYNVLATNEAKIELGVQPFDNSTRLYSGSTNDTLLNQKIKHYTSTGDVQTALLPYQTSGLLKVPLITMHTTMDPIVPFWHQTLYKEKVVSGESTANYLDLTIDSYGHCAFKTGQMLYVFARLIHDTNQQPVSQSVALAMLQDAAALQDFNSLNTQYGDVTRVKTYLPTVLK